MESDYDIVLQNPPSFTLCSLCVFSTGLFSFSLILRFVSQTVSPDIMKTSTFLSLSTSVFVGVLDVSLALSPPPRDYYSSLSSQGDASYPSKTYEYKFPTQTSSISEPPKYTESPGPVKDYPYLVELPNPQAENHDKDFPIPDGDYKPLPLPTVVLPGDFEGTDLSPDVIDPYLLPHDFGGRDLPDDIRDPFPIPNPQNPPTEGGFYEGPNGTKIAVVVRPPGYGENPIDRQVPSPVPFPHPPPPFRGDVVYGDGDKYFPTVSSQIDPADPLVESESALTLSDVTGKEPSKAVYKRKQESSLFFFKLRFHNR